MLNQSVMIPVTAEEDIPDQHHIEAQDIYSTARLMRRKTIALSIVCLGGTAALLTMLYAGTGAMFLYWDYLKGGHICNKTTGFKVWMFCLVNICFIPANINSLRATYKTHHTKLRIISLCVNFLIELTFVIYGDIVLHHPGPCEKFKHDAKLLWKWANFAYGVKIFTTVFIGLVIIALTVYYAYKHIILRRREREEEYLGDIPLAEAELRTNELHVQYVEDNPEPEIAGHPVFRPTPRMTQADAVSRPSSRSMNVIGQREPLLAEPMEVFGDNHV